MISSQKRGAQDSTDDELDSHERKSKKIKSRSSTAKRAIKTENSSDSLSGLRSVLLEVAIPVLSTSLPTPASTATSSKTPNLQSDPISEFDDTVSEFLGSIENTDEDNTTRTLLSGYQAKRLGRLVQDLSIQGLLIEVQIDTISTLLKYLESAMNEFDTTDIISMFSEEYEATEEDQFSVLDRLFDRITLTLEHVALSITLLNARGLQQHLFPEELLVGLLCVFKIHVEKFIVPALEFSKDDSGLSKGSGIFKGISEKAALKSRLLAIIGSTCDISDRLRKSGNKEVTDDIVVKLVYIGLGLFFIDTSSDLLVGPTEAESVKQSGSNLLRMVFAKHSKQRTWILEEILSMLIKLPHGKKVMKGYRLIEGSKIHTSSALLMQLVQTCAECPLTIELPVDFLHLHPSTQKIEAQKLLDDIKRITEEARTCIGYIFNVLLSRSMKNTKSSVDADYRTVLDTLVADMLTVLGHPEWPSAEFYLQSFSNAMARYLDDVKSDTIAKTMAVDTLGLIAAKLKTISNKVTADAFEDPSNENEEQQPYYGHLSIYTSTAELSYLKKNYDNVVEYLGSNEMNDTASKAAKNTWIGQWLAVICSAITKEHQEQTWDKDQWKILMQETLRQWKIFNGQESHSKTILQLTRKSVSRSGSYLTSRQQLFLSFDVMLSRILKALEGGSITLRAKSLRALSLIVTGDYVVLSQLNVRKTIALRLQDQSPSVRDAAIELVGKYMLQDPAICKAYYEIVSDRISDTGLNVRKRVLRLLKDMFYKASDPDIRNDISQKLLLRVYDDETTVKDLAIKSVSEVWFSPFLTAASISQEGRGDHISILSLTAPVTTSQKRDISKRSRALIEMIGKLSVSQAEAFGSVIQWLLAKERKADDHNLSDPRQTFSRTCAVIVDCLVDLVQTLQDEDAAKSSVASTVHTLHTFVKAEPRLIEAKHLGSLLVYLHCSSTSEDWKITMFVLRIFQDAIPVVKDMAPNGSQTIEKLTLALVAKCPLVLLPESVSVLCLTVRILTLHSGRLCKFFQTCVDLLSADVRRLQSGVTIQDNKTKRLMVIVGLLCKYFDFENVIKANPDEDHLADLKTKMPPSPQEYVFAILSSLCSCQYSTTIQQSALQSLGYVFMPFPVLMNSPRSVQIMDTIFASSDAALQKELLQIYANFLLKIQTTPLSGQDKEARYSLVAKAEDHMDAGIGSSIMQQYLDRILNCALVKDGSLQSAAVDVISQVTLQALVHPILCMPVIIALETCDNSTIRSRVLRIHYDLHQKHASLIYARAMECIRTAYTYQLSLYESKTGVQGYKVFAETGQPAAMICHMYKLVSDKRQPRNALLVGLVKLLEVDLSTSEVEVDGNYARFIAENLAYLDYRTMEESDGNVVSINSFCI
ncbi:Sister chromatid cohesion protein 2 [Linnemannia zychae]|nr:Sister chromatid cohesion protein 2 [Linnemannia zychae]